MGWLYKWACPTRKHIVDDLVGALFHQWVGDTGEGFYGLREAVVDVHASPAVERRKVVCRAFPARFQRWVLGIQGH